MDKGGVSKSLHSPVPVMGVLLLRQAYDVVNANELHMLTRPVEPPMEAPGIPFPMACGAHHEPPGFDTVPKVRGAFVVAWIN
jgi:hypothetical protein